jgi:hypothetical protein
MPPWARSVSRHFLERKLYFTPTPPRHDRSPQCCRKVTTGVVLATLWPLDKQANADGRRRVLGVQPDLGPEPAPSGIAPLLRELMNDYAATGLPPAYLPLPTRPAENDHE